MLPPWPPQLRLSAMPLRPSPALLLRALPLLTQLLRPLPVLLPLLPASNRFSPIRESRLRAAFFLPDRRLVMYGKVFEPGNFWIAGCR